MRRWWLWLNVDAREKLADAYEIGRREVDGVILAVGFPLPARDDERPVDGRAAELGGVAEKSFFGSGGVPPDGGGRGRGGRGGRGRRQPPRLTSPRRSTTSGSSR